MTNSIVEIIATELAEIKARQQVNSKMTLIFFEWLSEWAASNSGKDFTPGMFENKYQELYDHASTVYRQEILDQIRFSVEDEDGFVS